ncbi:MAG: ADP-ribosylglycohydrolase family protein [Vulcanimicrobiota bacterium]
MDERARGCLWGTALGDALGLCREGLSARRGQSMYPDLERYQLFGGRGLCSDDTEHAAFTYWALSGAADVGDFERRLGHAFRRWMRTLPAGVGWATLRAGLLGRGVHSAGNGPLMRVPVLAVAGPPDLEDYLRVSTRLTHTDPRVLERARQLAQVTRYLSGLCPWPEIPGLNEHPDQTPEEFVQARGWSGVSGFVEHTAPVVMLAALRHRDDFRQAVQSVIRCGGDTDTTAALVGGILGARLGGSGLPQDWLHAYGDWPHSLEQLQSGRLAPFTASLARNLVFGTCVLGYGLRRLLPPY